MRVPGQVRDIHYDNNSRLTHLSQGAQVSILLTMRSAPDSADPPQWCRYEYSYDTASRLTELVYRNTTGVLETHLSIRCGCNRAHVGGPSRARYSPIQWLRQL